MLRSRRFPWLALMLVLILAGPALGQQDESPNVSGDWSLTMEEGPQGVVSLDITFAQDDEGGITGTASGSMGSYEVTGLIETNQIMFYFLIGSPDAEDSSQWMFEGTVEENEEISGTMVGNMGEFSVEFTAERKEG